MAKNKNRIEPSSLWEKDLKHIKLLLVLLVNKVGVDKSEIAKSLGISTGRLSQILNPKKYRSS